MGPSEGCLQLEELVKQVVSPFLGVSEDRGVSGPTYTLGKGHRSRAARGLDGNATSHRDVPGLLLWMQPVQMCARSPSLFPTGLCLGNLLPTLGFPPEAPAVLVWSASLIRGFDLSLVPATFMSPGSATRSCLIAPAATEWKSRPWWISL